MLGAVTLVLSGCGFQWPEWATLDQDPLAFLTGANKERPEKPPPPDLIPAGERDQTQPESAYKPTSTMGVNLETYLIQDIDDPKTRLQRIENAMLAMHKDMQTMAGVEPWQEPEVLEPIVDGKALFPEPARVFDATGESAGTRATPGGPSEPRDTITPPKTRHLWHPSQKSEIPVGGTRINKVVPKPSAAAEPLPTPPQSLTPAAGPDTPAPPAQPDTYQPVAGSPASLAPSPAGGLSMTGMRVGRHHDKVRVVFDVSGKTDYSIDLDNASGILRVTVPNARWSSPNTNRSFGKTPVVQSFSAQPTSDNLGTTALVNLKKNTAILFEGKYPALSGPGERIVVDLSL